MIPGELVLLAWHNVSPPDNNEVVTVQPGLFVPETNGVKKFVQDDTVTKTTESQGKNLDTAPPADLTETPPSLQNVDIVSMICAINKPHARSSV